MSATAHSDKAPHYFVPQPSQWPALASLAMLLFITGASLSVNFISVGYWVLLAGLLVLFYVLYGWFGQTISESEAGLYSKNVDTSFRWSMGWFIFSEVMFFAAFFGALYYARSFAMPWLGDLDNRTVLWPDFTATWPHTGPAGVVDSFQTIGPFPIPPINTLLLLTSGVTLTWAHHALIANNRKHAIWGMILTIALGVIFLGFQAYEYIHAYRDLNLTLASGIFGSTFFMLTGFHGFHVTLGAIMLAVILYRLIKGHFKPESHFGFEAVAWYWHFVDVVWLGLYVVVYWM
jgi:cytochrome c oxidase subunit 3